ncbi:MAG: hypothetical protein ACR2RD_16565 [Woeseiaceae bacterium]
MQFSHYRIALLLLVFALFTNELAADGLESTDMTLVGERPNASGAATIVTFRLYLIDIDRIDDVQQRFHVDMFVIISWQDPRLALPEAERSGQNRTLQLDEIWHPRGLIVNDRGLVPKYPRIVDVDDLGNVAYRQRLSGPLAVGLNFKEFPFDTQLLPIDVTSYQYTADQVRVSPDSDISVVAESIGAEGWQFKVLEPAIGEFRAAEIVLPRLTYAIEAKRYVPYYVLTMFLPMSLIVFMSWTVFWLQPDLVPPRIAISTASIFSLIAFGFSIRLSLPPVSYLTRADFFVVGCTLLVFLALGMAVIGSRWARSDRMERALRLNAAVRWIYVVLFGVVGATAMVV